MDPNVQIVITSLISALSSSGVTSLIIYLLQRRDKRKDELAAKKSGQSQMLLGLGHDKIIYLTDRYVKRGAITLKEKRNLEFLYQPYAELGGNGDCKIGYDACQQLPVVSEEEAMYMDIVIKRKEYGLDDDE